ncbi:cyclodeaminase/cyclohydrolase family protein [Mesoaciditoga lauensis]|uniref:cyclodeaminase/cyclohydrolase family protein n=1 Tax=Mesoaciditoga lauensis TaxID=1495039 RepID=UPI00056063B6|nr:cyclodeaminase/cyclohydrolase family protein [Mesoaciditoga lauensis]
MKISDMTVKEFIDDVASKSPTPGGGAVGAAVAALGAALIQMVANLTIGKKGYEEYEAEMERIVAEADYRRKKILDSADDDIVAFNEVMKALKLPKSTPQEKEERKEKLQESLKKACEVPYELAREISKLCPLAESAMKFGNKNAHSDAESAVALLEAAFTCALANVEINLQSIKDEEFVSSMREAVSELKGKVDNCIINCKKM